MTPKDVKDFFKSGYRFGKATKMSDSSLVNWFKWGYVPYLSQKKLEKLTNGALKAVWDEDELKRHEVTTNE